MCPLTSSLATFASVFHTVLNGQGLERKIQLIAHHTMSTCWRLCAPSSHKPYIYGVNCHARGNATDGENTPTNPLITNSTPWQPPQKQLSPMPEEQPTPNVNKKWGDAGVHGFYCHGWRCIFNVCITSTSCCLNRNTDPLAVLKRHEKEKKDKYHDIYLERHVDFCPLVYSADRIPGRDTKASEKQLAKILSRKWNRLYSRMVNYVQVRMSVASVCSNLLLIPDLRCFIPRAFIGTGADMHDWQYWQER